MLTKITKFKNQLLDKFHLKEKATEYASHAFAKNTFVNYQSDWRQFCGWCSSMDIDPLKCDHKTLMAYITTLAEQGSKASTIQRKTSAIAKLSLMAHNKIDLKHPDFIVLWQGIRRKLGIAKKGKEPILVLTLKLILAAIPDNTKGVRDKALLAFGWASAMRRSEIVALNWEDLSFVDEGVIVTIRQSKTDKYGEGQKIAILYGRNRSTCPVCLLKAWQSISYTDDKQAVFASISRAGKNKNIRLSDRDVARIIKKYARAIGLEDSVLAGHSLRSGFITTASKNGVPNHTIMKHSRHKDPKMIHVYTRDNSLLTDNATSMVGL